MPCFLFRLRLIRAVLLTSAIGPSMLLSIALALYEVRLGWQTWRLPFVSELAAGPEGDLFRTTLMLQAASIVYVSLAFFDAQIHRVRNLLVAAKDIKSESGERAEWMLKLVFVGACIELVAALFTAVGQLLIARFDVFDDLAPHLFAVMLSYCSGCVWLAWATVVEWWLLSRNFLKWFACRVTATAGGVSSCLGCLTLVIRMVSTKLEPGEILQKIEDHTRNGVICQDSKFPVGSLNVLAFVEWANLVALPSFYILTFWDSSQFLRELPQEASPFQGWGIAPIGHPSCWKIPGAGMFRWTTETTAKIR